MCKDDRIQFAAGDRLLLRSHTSRTGSGLSYPAGFVTSLDDGASGGWDVYDSVTDAGEERSFYGFSVVRRVR